MADDIQLPGSGSVVATEELGGKHHQKVVEVDPANGIGVHPNDLLDIFKQILNTLAWPVYYDRSINKIKCDVQGANVTATLAANQDIRNVTAVATVTNLSQIDTYPAKLAVVGINTTAWAVACRNLIT